jgi:hypothetical protein
VWEEECVRKGEKEGKGVMKRKLRCGDQSAGRDATENAEIGRASDEGRSEGDG